MGLLRYVCLFGLLAFGGGCLWGDASLEVHTVPRVVCPTYPGCHVYYDRVYQVCSYSCYYHPHHPHHYPHPRPGVRVRVR
jgi:hypothetical protein